MHDMDWRQQQVNRLHVALGWRISVTPVLTLSPGSNLTVTAISGMIGPRRAKEHVVKRSRFTEDQIAFALKQAELSSSDKGLALTSATRMVLQWAPSCRPTVQSAGLESDARTPRRGRPVPRKPC